MLTDDQLEQMLTDDPGITTAMRAEAAARSHAMNNWTMAALITANGGAALTLLSQEKQGLALMIALALYMLGVTSALVAGRLGAVLAYHSEALFVSLANSDRANRHVLRVSRGGNQRQLELAQTNLERAEKATAESSQEFNAAHTPDLPLGLGVIFFFLGCIAAGFALF